MASFKIVVGALLALLLLTSGCAAPRGVSQLSMAAPAPPLQTLTSLSGETFDLVSTIKQHKATVLVWWSTRCPCVKRYQARMEGLKAHFGKRQVALLAIASNAGDRPAAIQRIVTKRQFRLPIVLDRGARLATYLGVRSTPAAVLLDHLGKVRYIGWIDNERKPGQAGRTPYLRNALEAVLTGRPVTRTRTTMLGCDITRALFAPRVTHTPKIHVKAHTKTAKPKAPRQCDCQRKSTSPTSP